MKKFFYFIIWFPVFAMSQPYTVKQLSIEKGLSNNYVVSIAQDKLGFLWFATEEGLNRFDGSNFVSFYKDRGSQEGITGNELNCVLDDPVDSILWIGTQRYGLDVYDYIHNTFRFYKHNPEQPYSLITNDITDIQPSSDGNLWISTYRKGIDYFDKKRMRFIHYNRQNVKGLTSDNVWSVTDGGDGKLYIGHAHGGFSILYIKERVAKNFTYNKLQPNSLPGNDVHCVYKDKNGNIWVGTDKGLALFDPQKEDFVSFGTYGSTLSNYVFDIRELNDNKLWVATEFGGISILDLTQRMFLLPYQVQFQYIKGGDDKYSLSSSSVRCIFQDSYNNVWTGLWGGGINFLSRTSSLFDILGYSTVNSDNNLNSKSVISACFDKTGKLWVGTDGGGINVFQGNKRINIYKNKSDGLSGNSIQAAFCDSKGNLWFGVFNGGAYCFSNGALHQVFPTNGKNTDVRSFYEDKQHQMFISTSDGIYKANILNHRITKHYTLTNNLVRSILKDSQGRIWVGTFGGGLIIYNSEFKSIHTFNTDNHFPSNTINQIYEDQRKRIWVATGEGLVCFQTPINWTYKLYGWNNGLNNIHIRSVTEDRNGNIWVGTNKEISCLVNGHTTFYNYDHHDNVPIGSYAIGCVTKKSDGTIYFGSLNGLCYFNPDNVLAKRKAPQAIITGIKIFSSLDNSEFKEADLHMVPNKKISLSYKQNNFNVTFNVRNYAYANQVEYAYILKGLDDAWYTVDDNSVSFHNIPPGKYTLLVKTRFHNQEWSKDTTSYEFKIEPPIWRTWWAEFIYLFIIIWAFTILLKLYKRKTHLKYLYASEKKNREHEQELNNERLRFYTNITHELRTPLTLIIGPLEDMMKEGSLSPKDEHKISIIHKSAIRLFNLINQILEFRKTETQNKKLCVKRENIVATVYEVGLKYKELNQKKSVKVNIVAEQDDITLYYDKEIVTIILDNLISNALKYTDNGSVTISVYIISEENNRYVEIKVADTGYGISAKAIPHVFDRYYQENSQHQASGTGIGLALVKNLVTLHEGSIRVDSVINGGSSFYLRLSADKNYSNKLHIDSDEEISFVEEQKSGGENNVPAIENEPILLIIEDNKDIRDYIAESLSEHFDVKTAENGKHGLDIAFDSIPDIIVSDIMMPEMDGIALCKKLKDDIRTSHIPIILLTAKDSLQDKENGYKVGADSYLTKPFSASLLMSRIQNLLEQRKRLSKKLSTSSIKNIDDKKVIVADALSKLDKDFIDRIDNLINDRLSSSKIDINYLADNLYMSSSTLYRKMKALTGLSANEYIHKVKMAHAEKLLLEGKYSISEIAFKIGMNSTGYFRQCFKEEFGMTPSDYIKKLKI